MKNKAACKVIVLAFTAAGLATSCRTGHTKAPLQTVSIVKSYAHDPEAFTQGLLYNGGFLYESTGRYGLSSLRKVNLETGRVLKIHRLPSVYFGEGLAAVGSRLVQLTWLQGKGFVYDIETLRQVDAFNFIPEGWGLTYDGKRLILSDGSSVLRFLHPLTFKETGYIQVTDAGQPVANLNELEMVRGEVLANVWMKNVIARIDPATGRVTGWLDLAALVRTKGSTERDAVLNGIAYDAEGDRLFVTGKLWSKLYQIKID